METNKDRAFKLFDQGFSPISPEVKALGLKNSTRGNYYYQWRNEHGIPAYSTHPRSSSSSSPGGEQIGGITETHVPIKDAKPPAHEREDFEIEAEQEKGEAGKGRAVDNIESVGEVSEVIAPRDKDGRTRGPEVKIATTVADNGIKCTVFLSLQTLALYRIAASTQAQLDGGEELSLGDFLDTCTEDYFRVRGKKLGLISSGGK